MPALIIQSLAPIFFVMLLGYVAGRMRTIDNHHVGEINALVMDFALPASLFVATASTPRVEMISQFPLFAIQGVVMLIPYAFWYVLQRRRARATQAEAAVQALTVAQPNYAAAGIPIVAALAGPQATVQVAVAIAAASLLSSPITLLLLELSGNGGQAGAQTSGARVWHALRRALTKPIVVAPLLGAALSLCGLRPGAVVDASLQLVGQAAGGVALFLTGLILSAQPFRMNRNVAGATVLSNVVRPLLALAIVRMLPIPSDIAKVSVLLAALPSGFFGILFGVNYRAGSAEAGSMVIASTVFSIFTLAVTIALLYPH
jgi:malonate transporter and related proteins